MVIPCAKEKLPHAAMAKDIYITQPFKRAKRLVESCGVDWFIFSAKYGLLYPTSVIEPYDLTIWHNNNMKAANKQKGTPLPPLADPLEIKILKEQANKILQNYDRRIYLMSRKYCEGLIQGEQPMYNMVFIKQQGFLSKSTRETFGL